jgi:hypothetical protein
MPRGVKLEMGPGQTAEYFYIAAPAFVSGQCARRHPQRPRAGKEVRKAHKDGDPPNTRITVFHPL